MAACCLKTHGRLFGATVLSFACLSPVAFGQVGNAVFVGDVDPAEVTPASGPALPTLSTPQTNAPKAAAAKPTGDPRYLSKRMMAASKPSRGGPVVRTGGTPGNLASRALYAEAANRQIGQAQAANEPKKSFFSRLVPSFARSDKQERAAAEPSPVMPASFASRSAPRDAYGDESGRVGGILQGPGTRNRTGLFSFGSSQPKPQRVAASRKRVKRTKSNQQPTAPRMLAATPAAKPVQQPKPLKQNPFNTVSAPPVSDGVVFVGDQDAGAKTPSTLPQLQQSPATKQPLITSNQPGPMTIENQALAGVSIATDGEPETLPAAPMPTYPATKKSTKTPTPQRELVASNPVPPAAVEQKPSARAIGLLVEANRLSQAATTEQDYTHIVQRCRHVLAIDASKTAVNYSRELASWALNKRGELLADAGRNHEAMNDFDDALAMDDGRWRATHNRGVLLAQAGKFAEAFDAFNETIEQNPKFAKAYSNRASLYVQAGDFVLAMEDYTRAIAADPDLAIAHKGQGRVCHMLGRMQQALRHLDAAVMLSPEDASIANCRADLLVDMGRYAGASDSYQQAIQLDPNLASAYRNLAWMQATCPDRRYQNHTQAIANAERAMQLAGAEDDISLDTLAAAQAAAGDFGNAVATIRRAIELAPAGDQEVYAQRLSLYEAGQAFTSAPVATVQQAGYQGTLK